MAGTDPRREPLFPLLFGFRIFAGAEGRAGSSSAPLQSRVAFPGSSEFNNLRSRVIHHTNYLPLAPHIYSLDEWSTVFTIWC